MKADPPPLTTGLLFADSEKELADPYQLSQVWHGADRTPEVSERTWRDRHSALGRECALCPDEEGYRLMPCCARDNWVHLECSHGVPGGRLCAARRQILDPISGVVASDFNCGKDELQRCLVPWRPWVKKYKEEWRAGKGAAKGAGKGRRMRNMHEMLPNWALEKHAWLGAGLMWKRIYGSTTGARKPQKNDAPQTRSYVPWKALPLIPIWDELYVKSTHTEFERHNGVAVLKELNDMTHTEMSRLKRGVEHGMVIGAMDHPYLLSPPRVPLPGATNTRPPSGPS